MPPKIHTTNTMAGEPTAFTIFFGTTNLPLPMVGPITTAIAAQGPRARRRVGLELSTNWVLLQDERSCQAGSERDRSSDENLPRPRDRRRKSNVEHQAQPRGHGPHRRRFSHPPRQQAEQ